MSDVNKKYFQIKRTNILFLGLFLQILLLFSANLHAEDIKVKTSEEVVSKFLEALQKNDAPSIRKAFADNASQLYERWYAREKTGDKFRAWLESDIIKTHGKVENPTLSVDGDSVIVTGQFENNQGYTSPADFLFEINKGKIVKWTIRYD